MKDVYISGPMRGYPNFNFAAFDEVRDHLAAMGHRPVSPADHDRAVYPGMESWEGFASGDTSLCPDFDIDAALRWDLRTITECHAIVLLPGWENSIGAKHEKYVAEACGLDVLYWSPPSPRVVGLTGYAQVGKDTAGAVFVAEGFERLAFANALKAVAYETNPDLCSAVRDFGWDVAKREHRQFLQTLGSAMRRHAGDDVWVNAVMRRIDAKPNKRFVITDVRYPNEAQAIRARGGVVIRIHRPGVGPANDHASEVGVDSIQPHFSLTNRASTAESFQDSVCTVIRQRLNRPGRLHSTPDGYDD